jgi:hypothetical protein
MRKLYIICILCFLLFESVFSQNIYFNRRIDITGYWEVCRGIVPFNKGYLVAGGHGPGYKIYLSYLDSVGNLKWSQHYTETNYNYFFGLSGSLFQTKDKYIAICGGRVLWPIGHSILIKVDSTGNKKWEREYELTDCSNTINCGNNTKDSGFILTGDANIVGLRYSYLLLKTDSLGNQQWYKTYTDNHAYRSYAGNSVIQTPDSGYCIGGDGGYWNPPATYYHSIVEIIKTDKQGNQQWKKTYGDPSNYNGGGMLCLSDDSCIIATYNLSNSSDPLSNFQLYIAKYGLDGSIKWDKKIGQVGPGKWTSWIQKIDNDGYILCGSLYVKDTLTKYIGYLFKLNNNGDSVWYREYAKIQGLNEANELNQVSTTSDKGFIAAGSLFPQPGNGGQDIWVFKTDSFGCLVPGCYVGITEFNPIAGAQMVVFPNPFSSAFAINYFIPAGNKEAVFQLFDIYGKLVYQTSLTKELKQLQVLVGTLKTGVYIAHLEVDGKKICSQRIIKSD